MKSLISFHENPLEPIESFQGHPSKPLHDSENALRVPFTIVKRPLRLVCNLQEEPPGLKINSVIFLWIVALNKSLAADIRWMFRSLGFHGNAMILSSRDYVLGEND